MMNILVTSAAAPLAQTLVKGLRANHAVRVTERVPVHGLADLAISPLGPDFSTNLLVRGMDAIIHVAAPLPTDSALQQIDYLTRCTYNLCMAAAAEGVSRLIYLNTLAVMEAYDEHDRVSEVWRPKPTTESALLAKHLGEMTCREFAREVALDVVSLRLGHLLPDATGEVNREPAAWIDQRDALHAVEQALSSELDRRWSIFHIQHKSARTRFPVTQAEEQLQFSPQYNEYAQVVGGLS